MPGMAGHCGKSNTQEGRRIRSLCPAWATQGAPGQPGQQSKTVSNYKETNKRFAWNKGVKEASFFFQMWVPHACPSSFRKIMETVQQNVYLRFIQLMFGCQSCRFFF